MAYKAPALPKRTHPSDADADIIGREYKTYGGERYRILGPAEHYKELLVSERLSGGTLAYACRDEVRKYLV